jgi:tRNA-dihydrouridine synthase
MNLEDYEILRKNIRRADDNVRRTKAAVENHVSVKLRLLAKKHKPF